MSVIPNGVTITAAVAKIVNAAGTVLSTTNLTEIKTNGGVTVWTAQTAPTYRWQKSYSTQSTIYIWKQYNIVDNSYYAEYDWSSPTPAGFSDIEGYTSCDFYSSGGYSYSGTGMATESSSTPVYIGDSTSVTKYYGSGGTLYSSYKSCRRIESYSVGSYVGEVQGTSTSDYPYTSGNGGDGYYYSYDRSTTTYSKGSNIEVVTSLSATAHNTTAGGAREADGYWYTYLGTA